MKNGESLFVEMMPEMPVLFINPLIISSMRRVPYEKCGDKMRAVYGIGKERFGMFTSKHPTPNLKFRILQPQIEGPHFKYDRPWEANNECGCYRTVLFDEGKYKMWYELLSVETREDDDCYMMYAESEDGFNWNKPTGDFTGQPRFANTGVVYPAGEKHFGGGVVFKDPCDPEFPYKMSYLSRDQKSAHPRLAYLWGGRSSNVNRMTQNCLRLARSKDGLHWERIDKPLMPNVFTDAQNSIYYHPRLEKYIVFMRTRLLYARAFASMETDDLANIPADAYYADIFSENPGYDIEAFNYTVYPWNDAIHLGLVIDHDYRYDSFFPRSMYTSLTGRQWSRIESEGDGLLLPERYYGEPRGMCYMTGHMVPLDSGRKMAVPISFNNSSHDYQVNGGMRSELFFATWDRDRLGYVGCEDEGCFSTINFKVQDNVKLVLNFKTAFSGEIQVQIADSNGVPLPGYSFEECITLKGDERAAEVSWGGVSCLPNNCDRQPSIIEFNSRMEYDKNEQTGLVFQFRLRNAKLFAMTIKQS